MAGFLHRKHPLKGGKQIIVRKVLRGDIYYADLDPVVGSEQSGFRPVVIIQNNTGNRFSSTVIVAAISSKSEKKTKMPTHCYIPAGNMLATPSIVLLEQIRTIDKSRLGRYIGNLSQTYMDKVDLALSISIGLAAKTHPNTRYSLDNKFRNDL